MRILIVDDDYISRTKLKALLAPYGDCDAVPSGNLAMQMFEKAHEESFAYGLISMDFYMPGMNGPDVVQKIRDWEHANKSYSSDDEVRILMTTASSENKDIVSSFKEGCEWYLNKPATTEKVREAMVKLGVISS